MYATNIKLLNRKIVEKGTSPESIALETGIGLKTFNKRMRSGKFLIGEIKKTCFVLKLTPLEAKEVFMNVPSNEYSKEI